VYFMPGFNPRQRRTPSGVEEDSDSGVVGSDASTSS
jgi:hypothetical protein